MPVVGGLGWTFDTAAKTYEKFRPGYPSALYDDLFAAMPLDSSSRALEIGIGGGQATAPILQSGCAVTAVERGENFCAICREKFREYPGFSAIPARFEEFVGERDAYDLVYSASAFHWIPEEIGYPKVFRMLKTGGVFARFANHPGRDEGRPALWEDIQALYRIYMPDSAPPRAYTAEMAAQRAELAQKYGFAQTDYKLYRRTRSFSAAEYMQLLGTYSDHIALGEARRQAFSAAIGEAIERHGGTLTIYDTVDLQLARKI